MFQLHSIHSAKPITTDIVSVLAFGPSSAQASSRPSHFHSLKSKFLAGGWWVYIYMGVHSQY